MSTHFMFPSRYPNTIICTNCGYVGPSEVKYISKVKYWNKETNYYFDIEGKKVNVKKFTRDKRKEMLKTNKVIKYLNESYKSVPYDDDVDTCPHCGNSKILGTIIRKYDTAINRFVLSRENEPLNKKPYVKERYLNSGRLYNDLEVSMLKWKQWNEIGETPIKMTSSYKSIIDRLEKELYVTVTNMLKKGHSREQCIEYIHKVRNKAKSRGFVASNIERKVLEDLPSVVDSLKIRHKIEISKLINNSKHLSKKKQEYIKMKNYIKRLRDHYIYDALKSEAIKTGKRFVYNPDRSLYDQMKDYGIENNLNIIDNIVLSKFFPSYGKNHWLEINERVIELWDEKYHNGDNLANIWDNLTHGYDSPKDVVISKLAFTLLSKSEREHGLLLLRDKRVSVYERDIKRTLEYNKDISEWYESNKEIMEDPSMDLDRGEISNGIKVIDGISHFFDPSENKWISCEFITEDSDRFVNYEEPTYDDEEEVTDEPIYEEQSEYTEELIEE